MAKQGKHEHDHTDNRVARGHNNPKESTPITTGSPKKQETYAEQARQHRDTDPVAQVDKNEWHRDTNDLDPVSKRDAEGRGQSGSESNAGKGTKGH